MKPYAKVGLISAGYFVALGLAAVAVLLHGFINTNPADQASSGMAAFGDLLLFGAVFASCSLPPTAAALFLLRPYPRAWTCLSVLCLTVALTGFPAGIMLSSNKSSLSSTLAVWHALAMTRTFAAPMLLVFFLASCPLAPSRASRILLLASAILELALCAYVSVFWLLPRIIGH